MNRSFRLSRAWPFVGPVAALMLVFAGAFAFRIPLNAHAAKSKTLYVGQTVGSDTSCSSPGFTSVQAAVNAASTGNTVYLCGTKPYAEQVIIQKAITLTGDPGAGIVAPNPFPSTSLSQLPPQFTTDNLFVPQAIVIVWGSGANATIKNLTISGVLPGNNSCADDEFGVLVIDGGTATLTGDKVINIRDSNPSLYGCQFGVAIQVGREYWPKADFSTFLVENFVGHATISHTGVSGYQKNGITVDGPGTTFNFSYNTVTGAGQTDTNLSPIIAQNGIQISRGAAGQAQYNNVSGNAYTGPGGASSGGILVYGGSCDGPATPLETNIEVEHNTLTGNDVGIYLSNLIYDNNKQCSLPTTVTNNKASNNHISNGAITNVSGPNLFNYPGGYQAGISEEGYGDTIITNQICGAGYTPAASPPPYLSQIDIVATNPTVSGNTTCNSSSNAFYTYSGARTVKKGHYIRYVFSPVR